MPVYDVGQVARYLKELLEQDSFLADVWVSGEVSNLVTSQAKHTYFTLKDAQAQLRCVMFQGGQGADLLANGSAIIAHSRIAFYEARGLVELRVDIVVPEGTGALQLQYEELKRRLEQEGLFDASRKRALPAFPHRIGVVTSPTGAVFHDICNVLKRRYPLATVVLAPAKVQGDGAAATVVAAIQALNALGDIDVIIVARGGGSLEELWAFNEEPVARAIYASKIPIISGVGHETDTTIADYVADVRAPTPSAAAELVAPDVAALALAVADYRRRVRAGLLELLKRCRGDYESCVQRLGALKPGVGDWRRRVDDLSRAAERSVAAYIALLKERVSGMEMRAVALDPCRTIGRGYAIVQDASTGEIVSRVAQAQPGEALKITVSDGSFPARAGEAEKRREARKPHVYAGERLL